MSQQVFLEYVRQFTLNFTQKTIQSMRKLLDPFNFKYKRPFNILSPQDNPQQYSNKQPLTQRVLQLSLVKLCLDLIDDKNNNSSNKSYMFGTFCEFLSENLSEIIIGSRGKDNNGMMRMLVFLLCKMVRQWISKTYSMQVIKNEQQLQIILLTLKQFLQQFVNKQYIKNETQKVGTYSPNKTMKQPPSPQNHPFSPSSLIINTSFSHQSQLPNRVTLYNQHENAPAQLIIQFTSSYTMPELYLSVYSLLIFLYYYNDQSMIFREEKSATINNVKKSQILSSMIHENSPKKEMTNMINNINDQQQKYSQQSRYFTKEYFLSLLAQSLEILFYLSTGGKQLSMLTQMFIMCSHLIVFKQNSQKPTLLRLVLYGEKKLTKQYSWQHLQISNQLQSKYLKLMTNYLMLDPKFRHKLLGLIQQWLQMGIDLGNQQLMSHWKVLINTVNKRIFQGLLQGEMFNLLISKSQGNRHCRIHVGNLLSEMVQHISIDIIVKNSQQIFCLEQFLDQKKVKLLEIYFECIKRILERKKNISNKTMVNRVIGLYLEFKQETKIKKMDFIQLFRMLVQNSIESSQKLFTDKILKAIHIPHQPYTNFMLSSSQKQLGNSRRLTQQQIDLSQSARSNITALSYASSSKFIFTSNIMMMDFNDNAHQNQLQQVQQVEIIMLRELLQQKKKGESYFIKFIKEINKSYFNEDNIKVYEIYSGYLVNKLTDYSLSLPEFNKPIQLTATPQAFQRYSALYETLFAITNDKKVLSPKLYKLMLLLEAVTERQKLSQRHHWFVRKLKYFFAQIQHQHQQQSIRSRIISMSGSEIPRMDISVDLSRKTSMEYPQSRIEINQKLCLSLFDYIKSLFVKLKNKTTFLALISMFCLRYCQTHRKVINMQKKQQNKRKSATEHELASQLGEIGDFLQANNYALLLSTSSISTTILMILYNLVLMNEYVTHSGTKSNIFQTGGKIKQFENADFFQIDENPLLIEIRKILVLMIDSFTPYQINQFLYMFTMKQSQGEKLIAYLGLPSFQSIPLIARIQPIIKIVKQITTRKYLSLEKRQILLPFYNHIEFDFIQIPKNEFSMLKNDQKTYIISIEMLINWQIKCDNFISFWTNKGKYKLILKQQQFSLLYRKDGSNQTQRIKDYEIKQQIKEKLVIQMVIKSKEINVYLQKKKVVATISCDSQIQGIKLQMINGLLVQKASAAKTSPQIDFHQRPQLTSIQFCKSFSKLQQIELQVKIKQITLINNQAAWITFPYEKYYFLVKKLFKFNKDLAQHSAYQFLYIILTETYLKMLENKAITTSSFIANSGKYLELNNNNFSASIAQSKRQSQSYVSNKVDPQEMWKKLIKKMTNVFIENKSQSKQKQRIRKVSTSRIQRKYSQDTAFMKLNLMRTDSSKSKPQNQEDELIFGRGSASSIEISNFLEIASLPDIKKSSKIICSNGFACYLLEILLRKQLWQFWLEKDKLQISIFLKELCSNKEFLTQIENNTFDIFYNLINVFEKISQNEPMVSLNLNESKQSFSQLPQSSLSNYSQSLKKLIIKNLSLSIKQILLSHQLSQKLRQKFRYLFYIGETGKSKLVKQLFLSILDKLSSSLLINDSSTNAKMSRWLFIESQRFEYVFGTCHEQTRCRILDYLSEISLQDQQNKLIKFMQKLSLQMLYEIRMWMMIFIKKLLFKLKMKQNVLKLMRQLGQMVGLLLKVAEDIKDKAQKEHKDKTQKQTQKQQLLKIIQQSIIYLQKRQQLNQPISLQLQVILTNQNFIKYFQSLITQNVLIPTMNSNCSIYKLCSVIFIAIFGLEKKLLLKALSTYRRVANKIIPLLIYPSKLQVTRKLSVYQLNCFLQYILESTLSVQNSIGAQEKSYFVISVKTYLQWIIKNYHSQKQQISSPLVYVYPKLYHVLNCHSKKELQKKLRAVGNLELMELRGGIYFKIIVTVVHLIQMKPDQDLSLLVEIIMFKPLDQKELKQQRQSYAAFKAMNDFSQVQSSSRQRTFVQKLINQLSSSHKLYCTQYDKPLQPLQVISNKLFKFQQENDLTTFCVDYMLMKLVQYLSESINKLYDPNVQEVKKKYLALICKALEKFPLICNDLNQKNLDSPIVIQDYSSLVQLLTIDEQELLVGQKLTTPKSRYDIEMETPSTPHKDHIDESYFQKLHTQTPSKSMKNIQLYENQRFSKTAGKRDELFLNVGVEQKKRKKSFHYFLTNQNSKIRDGIVDLMRKDHKKWGIECRQKMFSRFFRDQAKQLLINELMFTFYVENTVFKPAMSTITQKQARMLQKYYQSIEQDIQKYEEQMYKSEWSKKKLVRFFNIKRISPYFLQNPPILKVKGCGFPNMCMPIMTQIPKPSYKLQDRQLKKREDLFNSVIADQQQFRMDMFGIGSHDQQSDFILEEKQDRISIKDDFDNQLDLSYNIATTPKKSLYEGSEKSCRHKSYVCLQQIDNDQNLNKKKPQSTYCELVTRKGVYFCEWRIELRQNPQNDAKNGRPQSGKKQKLYPILVLQTCKQKPQQCPRYLKYGSPTSNLLSSQKQIQVPLKLIREVFFRKYNQIPNNSIQLFCSDGRQHFICLYSIQRAEALVQSINQNTKFMTKMKIFRHPQKEFQAKQYTNKWMNGQIDNFTYLMLINKFSGRSFCDTNQYPVFPWVVSDYRSKQLDLNDIKTYRDLTKPIGALNENKLNKYYEKYYLQNQDTGIFLYGSHFSTSLFIYYFLVRMEPFSSLHQQMQGGSWDAPDRLFSSMQHMWDSLMSASSATDIKESIPEFYYFPFFLKNTNHIDLGMRQSGQQVNNVKLPPWSDSPQDFVNKMRLAFQSNYVSLNLPYWIDLIFGIDQKNIKRHNLFHPLSYSQNINIEKIAERDLEARICQISYFGQFPIKMFTKAHKMKKLAINKIFTRDILTSGFIRSSSVGKKETEDILALTLPITFSIASISKKTRFENTPSCILKVKNISLNVEIQTQIDPKIQGLQNIIKKLTSSSKDYERSNKKRQASFTTKEKQSSTNRFKDPYYIGYSEPRTCTIMSKVTPNLLTFYSASNPNLTLASYWFQSRYSFHLYNESFVILYGEDGLIILNWNFQEIFAYSKRSIDCCFVDEFLVFIATKDGRVYVYDMVAKNMNHIVDLSLVQEEIKRKEKQSKIEKLSKSEKDKLKEKQKEPKIEKIYSTKMKVFFDKKLISSSCEEQYKIILVVNDNKIFIVNYKYLKRNWVNVEKD